MIGWALINLPCANWRKRGPMTPMRASVDRIDSTKDYTMDNIRFVSIMVQYAKNSFTDKELRQFFEAVANHTLLMND